MRFPDDTVLVTGANGWLGKNLVKRLVQGLPDHPDLMEAHRPLKIRCFVLPDTDTKFLTDLPGDVEIFEGDVRDPTSLEPFCRDAAGATLFHTAGIIHPRRVREFREINLEGTRNLLTAAVKNEVRRAVVVSSNSPLGCNPHHDHLFDEESPYNPYMGYGQSKRDMELCVREFQVLGSIQTVLVRCPWFYGPEQPPRQTVFFSMIKKGKVPVLGRGSNRRSMSYVDNLVQGLLLAGLKECANGELYWIADERPYAMTEIFDTVGQLLETEFGMTVSKKRMRLPSLAAELAGTADWFIQKLGRYHQKIHVLSEMNKTIACSTKKAQDQLGYRPGVALEEGMRRSIQWCLDQGIDI